MLTLQTMMKVTFLLAVLAVSFVSAFDFPEEWKAWKSTHKKVYKSVEEELKRHTIWQSNKKYIDEHNEHADVHGFTVDMNEYGDMDPAEFAKIFNGYKTRKPLTKSHCSKYSPSGSVNITELDWRKVGYVTEVKNQGQCGSCWAFSTTGSLEGQHYRDKGKLVSLSEQNLVDCSDSEGNEGCNGGLMDDAFDYIIKNDGIDTEKSYPYKAEDGKCNFKKSDVGAKMKKCRDIKSESEKDLLDAVAHIGPISVAIDASHMSFQFYRSGVYYESSCSTSQLDHGVLAVGFGVHKGLFKTSDYWLVKNSWDTSWGMDGYIMMSRNRDNNCGIATQASYPEV